MGTAEAIRIHCVVITDRPQGQLCLYFVLTLRSFVQRCQYQANGKLTADRPK
jgi:hypothetical protein